MNWFCCVNKFSIIYIQQFPLIAEPFLNQPVSWQIFLLGQISDCNFFKRVIFRRTFSWSDNNSPVGHLPDKRFFNHIFPHYDIYPTELCPVPVFSCPWTIFAFFHLSCLFIKLGLICRPHNDGSLILVVFGTRAKWIYFITWKAFPQLLLLLWSSKWKLI